MSVCVSISSVAVSKGSCIIEREGYTLAVSHGRPGISQQMFGLPCLTQRTVNVDI